MSNKEVFITADDQHLFNEGRNFRSYSKLGAHVREVGGETGVQFSVWAPNAKRISVIGDFNDWDKEKHDLQPAGSSGIWTGFFPGVKKGARYKYHIWSKWNDYEVDKADPYAFYAEIPPLTASTVWDLNYEWSDQQWMEQRKERQNANKAMSIYEVHLGSWMRNPEDGDRSLSYRELAEKLPAYVSNMGFTHVELLPIMEHPFYGSWGYQTTGYFAPTSRYGTPQDFMYLIDSFHQQGVGVILDWVPSHFPADEHALGYFDGTHLFEHSDFRQGYHPDWNSLIYNYGRNEVRSFLISSAMFWLEHYHIDGIRVDAVASMIYLDYSRKEGEWIPNKYGGRENLEALQFLKELNEEIYGTHPDVHTIAEESTAWPMVSRPTYLGGLGFGMKWDMGWMHDTLTYFKKDPVYREYHQGDLTFRMVYAFNENFVLSLSHDEVVHGKGSILDRMPGDTWQKFANARALYAYMFAQPGKKLMFMGDEFAQGREWNHESSLDWHLLEDGWHKGISRLIHDLNELYEKEKALHELDFSSEGFEWLDASDVENSVLSFFRKSKKGGEKILVVFNLTPMTRENYRLGVNEEGWWSELLNTDADSYGGSGAGNMGRVETSPVQAHGRPYSLSLTLPPLGALFMKWGGSSD